MTTTLYYFTGTGNSLFAARKLAEQLEDCQLISIASVWQAESIAPATQVIGIVCPTYYIGPPQIVKDFIRKLDLTGVQYIFAVPTRGLAVAIGTTRHIRDLLKAKGRDLDLGMYVTMGQSFTPNHRVPTPEQAAALNRKAEARLVHIAALIKARRRKQEYNQGYFLTPWVHPRFMQNVNQRDRGFTVEAQKCNSCGVCRQICPVNNIDCSDSRPVWQGHCQLCLACVMWCPREAIEYQGLEKVEGSTRGKPRYRNPEISLRDLRQQKA